MIKYSIKRKVKNKKQILTILVFEKVFFEQSLLKMFRSNF